MYLGWLVLLCVGCGADDQVSAPQTDSASPVSTPQESKQPVAATYVGSETCAGCHRQVYKLWQGSQHQVAMQTAAKTSVLADFANASLDDDGTQSRFLTQQNKFVVATEGPSDQLLEYQVRYTFGVYPLQQYLVELEPGRLQALRTAWDSRTIDSGGQKWFHLYPGEHIAPDDVLHWTQGSGNWNSMCADCHSTAFTKGYEADANVYNSTYAEISVGCEACHGPGSEHVASGGALNLAVLSDQPQQIDSCAPCHSRRSQLAEGFQPARAYLDHYSPALLDQDLYYADGQILDEVYVYGSFLQSKMHQRGVACSDCHNPHTATLKLSGNALCEQCHNPAGRAEFPTLKKQQYNAASHHMHAEDSAGAQCVACHMTERTYMVVDPRRDHSFRIPRPDLTRELGIPNACNQCHTEQSPVWAEAAIVQQFGKRSPHYGQTLAAGRQAEAQAEFALVALADDTKAPVIVRATALSLLANFELRVSSQALGRYLSHDEPLLRIGALRGAARFSPSQLWQAVSALLADPLLAVRMEAVRTLLPSFAALDPAQRDQFEPFLKAYLAQLQLHADSAQGQSNIASVHRALGNLQAAEAALRMSLVLNASWVPGLVNLADLYRSSGRDHKAGPLLDRALALTPAAPDVLLAKGLWLVRQGQADAALDYFKQAYNSAAFGVRYAYVYMIALHSAGQSDAAFAVADEVLANRFEQQIAEAALSMARDTQRADLRMRYAKMLQR